LARNQSRSATLRSVDSDNLQEDGEERAKTIEKKRKRRKGSLEAKEKNMSTKKTKKRTMKMKKTNKKKMKKTKRRKERKDINKKKRQRSTKKSKRNESTRRDRGGKCRLMPPFRSKASGIWAAGRVSRAVVALPRHYHPSSLPTRPETVRDDNPGHGTLLLKSFDFPQVLEFQ
jgi:hypothetical protein